MSFFNSKDKNLVPVSKRRINLPYASSGMEPSLHEMLSDPIIHLIAQSDKIALKDLIVHMEQARLKIKKMPTHLDY